MMKEKHFIYMNDKQRFIEILGHKVEFEGFKKFEFFIHRFTGDKNIFAISEKTSGSRIALGLTVREAYENTERILRREGTKRLKNVISNALKVTGPAREMDLMKLAGYKLTTVKNENGTYTHTYKGSKKRNV